MTWSAFFIHLFLYASTLIVLVFIVLYGLLAKWEKTAIGRHLMTFSIINFLVLFQVSMVLHFGNYPGRSTIGPVTYALFFFAWLWRLIMFLRDNIEARKSTKG